MADRKTVCVVGAGVAGLVSVKECLQGGLRPTCYDMDSDFGGTWHQKAEPDKSTTPNVWSTLVTNTPKHCTAFSDFPAPTVQTPYMSMQDMKNYLNDYAKHFGLEDYISLNTKVVKICRAEDFNSTGRWVVYSRRVDSARPDGGDSLTNCKREIFDAVMVCTGYFRQPVYPNVAGKDTFTGKAIHSYYYTGARSWYNKTVLIVGNSYSAIDIAEDVSNHAEKVILAVGRGCWILPRITSGGIPYLETPICSRSAIYSSDTERRSNEFLMDQCKMRLDHDKARIRPAALPKKSSIPMGESIQIRIMTGKVQIYGYLESIDGNSATFQDSSVVSGVDGIIYCTGFRPDLSFLDEDIIKEDSRLELYLMMYPLHMRHNTMALIGHTGSDGSFPPFAELQARYAVKVTKGECQLPCHADMQANVHMLNTGGFRKRQTYYIPGHIVKDLIAEKLGAYPSFWKILVRDPLLAFRVWYGPVYNAHYRLLGPDSNWEQASRLSHQAYEEIGICHGPKPLGTMPATEEKLAKCQRLATWAACVVVPLGAMLFGTYTHLIQG